MCVRTVYVGQRGLGLAQIPLGPGPFLSSMASAIHILAPGGGEESTEHVGPFPAHQTIHTSTHTLVPRRTKLLPSLSVLYRRPIAVMCVRPGVRVHLCVYGGNDQLTSGL